MTTKQAADLRAIILKYTAELSSKSTVVLYTELQDFIADITNTLPYYKVPLRERDEV